MNKENFSFQQNDQYSKVVQQKLGAVLHTLKENSSIPMPLKIAFQAVREMLELQNDTLEYLQEQMPKKASKAELHQLLAQKVSVVDLSSSLGDFRDILDKKISAAEFNTTLEESHAITRIDRRIEAIESKANSENEIMSCVMREIGDTVDRLQKEIQKRTEDINRESKELKSVVGKVNEKFERQLEKQKGQTQRSISKLHEEVKHFEFALGESRTFLIKQIEESTARIQTLTTSASTNHIKHAAGKQELLHILQSVKQACEDNEKEIKKLSNSAGKGMKKKEYEAIQETVVKAVEKLRSEFTEYVSDKVQISKPTSNQIHEPKQSKFASKQHLTRQLMQLELVLNGKTSLQEVKLAFKAFEQDMLYNLEALKNDLNRRIDNELIIQAKQPVELYERSPLLSKSAVSVQQNYLSVQEFRRYERDQNIIYESLCSENIVGRWSFKGEGLASGSKVASWDTELINTLPDNYVWVPTSHYIKVKNSGLYRLIVGLFTTFHEPQAELLVNERRLEVVRYGEENSGASEEVAKTLETYVYLKENSRLSVYFSSNRQTEGFLYVKRL